MNNKKLILRIFGILITIFSSAYMIFTISMLSMSASYGIKVSNILILLPLTPLIIGIIMIKKSK